MGVDATKVPQITLNNGTKVPCIGMGTFGSDRFTPEQVSAAVAGAIRAGYRMFDCAACYGNELVKCLRMLLTRELLKERIFTS